MLMGSKRKRGRDPCLDNLIDINEDDVKVDGQTYRKHHSEEAIERLYKVVSGWTLQVLVCVTGSMPMQPEGQAPTSQQKRKHQLSYLAHEVSCPPLPS